MPSTGIRVADDPRALVGPLRWRSSTTARSATGMRSGLLGGTPMRLCGSGRQSLDVAD
jgi:hypothetical protein